MTEMPPIQFANLNGIRMGYYEAGPKTDALPIVLCHGWPEIAFTWRHQLKAFADAGHRVIAPDQRGYGSTSVPEKIEEYDLDHLTGDLVALLDHLGIAKAIFVGHDWGGFVVWAMAMRHPERVAGVVGVNTPHLARTPIDPIELYKKRYGDSMYIVQFQDLSKKADHIFESRVEQTIDFFMKKPMPLPPSKPVGAQSAAAEQKAAPPSLAFPQFVAAYDASKDRREAILTNDERQVFIDAFKQSGFTGGINWYRNFTRNWERAATLDHIIRVPCLMVMAELDVVLPPSACDHMHELIPDLEKHLIKDCGHWTQQEKPEELNAKILEWYGRRFNA
jgi:pimeloyl-ACP methyl ester carboxylesterase